MAVLEKVHYKCPYCGHESSRFYDLMTEPTPCFFLCNDCHRHFGNESNISFEERQIIYDECIKCASTMHMAELPTVLLAVETFFRNYYRGCGALPIVLVKDGRVENPMVDSPRRLLTTYSVTSPINDQWLCVQCYFHLCKTMPHNVFTLGDYGITMD